MERKSVREYMNETIGICPKGKNKNKQKMGDYWGVDGRALWMDGDQNWICGG